MSPLICLQSWLSVFFGVRCVVDAKYVVRHVKVDKRGATNVNEAAQQIAFADLILINKIDVVNKSELETVKQTVRTINRSASWIDCQLNKEDRSGCPDLSQILNVDSFSLERIQRLDPSFLESDSDSDAGPENKDSWGSVGHNNNVCVTSEGEEEEERHRPFPPSPGVGSE